MREKVERGIASCDLIVSTAGVSVGEYDYLRSGLEDLGCRMVVTKVRMRPGSPTSFGIVRACRGSACPGIPSRPWSASSCSCGRRCGRCRDTPLLHRRTVRAVTDEPLKTPGRLTHFLRAVLRETPDGWRARLTGPQGSGILTSMTSANALLIVPEEVEELPAEAEVNALPLDEARTRTAVPPVDGGCDEGDDAHQVMTDLGEAQWTIRLNQEMLEALKRAKHIPPDVQKDIDAARPEPGTSPPCYRLHLSDDEAMELSELVQWHVRTDPATGQATAETAPYAEIIRLITEAQL